MQSRRKWKIRYYRERKRRKEADEAIEQLYSDYNDAGNKMFEYAEQVEQLETKERKLIETNNKYLQKLVYALTPTTHALGTDTNNAFKQIIADNIDLETCKIRRKLKEFWGVDKY